MPETYAGTHKRKVKVFTILSRIFLPVGIVFLASGIISLSVGLPFLIQTIVGAAESTDCIVAETSIRCQGYTGALIFIFTTWVSLGSCAFIIGLPMFILNFVFRNIARRNKAEDEARGIQY